MSGTGALCVLVSGTPGAGKTALAVSLIQEHLLKSPDRPVFVMGIPELSLPHSPVPPVADWTISQAHPDDPSISYPTYTFPDGALVVIDECQNVFRARTSTSKVPDHVAAMERHRHKGIDFILITQSPMMIDPTIRRLVGKHLHIRSLWSGRRLYEWPEVVNPESVVDRNRAVCTSYRLPKAVFDKYKSSSLHVTQDRKIPKIFFAVCIGLVLISFLGYLLYVKIDNSIHPKMDEKHVSNDTVINNSAAFSSASSGIPTVAGISLSDYKPRLPQRPETAPLYDGIRQPKVMPIVAGCLSMGDRCTCYSQQGTNLFFGREECRAWIVDRPFNPYLASASPGDGSAPADASVASKRGADPVSRM